MAAERDAERRAAVLAPKLPEADRAEFRAAALRHHGLVEGAEQLTRRAWLDRRRPERVAGERGDGCGLGALARHVADDERPLAVTAREDVVEVAADLVQLTRGAVAHSHLDAGDLRQSRRE